MRPQRISHLRDAAKMPLLRMRRSRATARYCRCLTIQPGGQQAVRGTGAMAAVLAIRLSEPIWHWDSAATAVNEDLSDTTEKYNGFPAGANGAAPPAVIHQPRHHCGRRLCVAEGQQLAGGAARSRCPARGYPKVSRSGERLHREPARPYRGPAKNAG